MGKMTEQYLLKMAPSLSDLIDRAFSAHLKATGEYISKAEYIRRCLEQKCNEELRNDD